MTPAQYVFINKGLAMSTGKAIAQGAHASVNAYEATPDNNTKRVWWRGGHHMKLVMECRDREHLLDTERYLNERGIGTSLVIDEGHTEVDPIVPTALATHIVDKDDAHVRATLQSFKLYSDKDRDRAVTEFAATVACHATAKKLLDMGAIKWRFRKSVNEVINKEKGACQQ